MQVKKYCFSSESVRRLLGVGVACRLGMQYGDLAPCKGVTTATGFYRKQGKACAHVPVWMPAAAVVKYS